MRNKTIIIAEAGVNHNGDLAIAKKLVDAAADAKVDFVKFQTFKAKNLVSDKAKLANYQEKNQSAGPNTQLKMLEKLELSAQAHQELITYSNAKDVKFLSTGFDIESIDLLDRLGIELFKIPSGEITNLPYLQHIASKNKAVILSTGMANLAEIEAALNVLLKGGLSQEQITILHCNTEYPTPMKDVNLLAMLQIKKQLNVAIGYSDHTLGIEVPIAAVALGATVIEKHFTLDRTMPGPDHRASLEPSELAEMVKAIRNIEQAVSGSGEKTPSPSESKNITAARKSIHLNKSMNKGELIKASDLIMLRPGDGISPMEMTKVLGKKLSKSLSSGHQLSWKDLQ